MSDSTRKDIHDERKNDPNIIYKRIKNRLATSIINAKVRHICIYWNDEISFVEINLPYLCSVNLLIFSLDVVDNTVILVIEKPIRIAMNAIRLPEMLYNT